MSNKDNLPNGIGEGEDLSEPMDEEESPNRVIGLHKIGDKVKILIGKAPAQEDIRKRLEAKDSTAYNLTRLCIFVVAIIWFCDSCFNGASELTGQVIDLLKYVITASLGFFFGSSKPSQNNSDDKE